MRSSASSGAAALVGLPSSLVKASALPRAATFPRALALAASLAGGASGCVDARCYADADCAAPNICLLSGRCGVECRDAEDCGEGFACTTGRCVPAARPEGLSCPADMAAVGAAFCVDRYEASRPDATATEAGVDESRAVAAAGVLPWEVRDNAAARAACQAAGKDLCTAQQWRAACEGSSKTVYGYGDNYEPQHCNGIDLFGRSGFHLLPTGSLPACQSDWGAFDLNGNLWEHVQDGSDRTVRGGAYNCNDSRTLHRCDYVPGNWSPSARGFRCCR